MDHPPPHHGPANKGPLNSNSNTAQRRANLCHAEHFGKGRLFPVCRQADFLALPFFFGRAKKKGSTRAGQSGWTEPPLTSTSKRKYVTRRTQRLDRAAPNKHEQKKVHHAQDRADGSVVQDKATEAKSPWENIPFYTILRNFRVYGIPKYTRLYPFRNERKNP